MVAKGARPFCKRPGPFNTSQGIHREVGFDNNCVRLKLCKWLETLGDFFRNHGVLGCLLG